MKNNALPIALVIGGVVVILGLASLSVLDIKQKPVESTPVVVVSDSDQVTDLVNQARTFSGLSPVVSNDALDSFAKTIAVQAGFDNPQDLEAYQKNKGSVQSQSDIKKYFTDRGYQVASFGEIWGAGEAPTVVQLWLRTQFQSVLLSPRFTDIGVASATIQGHKVIFAVFGSTK